VRVRHVLIAAGIVATAASCAGVPIFDPPAPRAPATGAAAQVVDGRGPLPPAQSAVVVRRLEHNYEADVIVLSAAFARDMERLFALDVDASHEITLDAWRRRGLGSRVTEWFARRWEHFL